MVRWLIIFVAVATGAATAFAQKERPKYIFRGVGPEELAARCLPPDQRAAALARVPRLRGRNGAPFFAVVGPDYSAQIASYCQDGGGIIVFSCDPKNIGPTPYEGYVNAKVVELAPDAEPLGVVPRPKDFTRPFDFPEGSCSHLFPTAKKSNPLLLGGPRCGPLLLGGAGLLLCRDQIAATANQLENENCSMVSAAFQWTPPGAILCPDQVDPVTEPERYTQIEEAKNLTWVTLPYLLWDYPTYLLETRQRQRAMCVQSIQRHDLAPERNR